MTIIDVSRHQGVIAWPRVAAAGVTTAIMRATLGGAGRDDQFAANWQGSREAGIASRGVYHYVVTEHAAAAQVANILAVTGGDFGNEPLTLDCERRKDERESPNPFPRVAYTAKLLEMVTALGPHAPLGIRLYTSKVEWAAITTGPVWGYDYQHWLAHYNAHITSPDCPPGWAWDWWQYTSTGSVDGVSTGVDLSRARVPGQQPPTPAATLTPAEQATIAQAASEMRALAGKLEGIA